MEQIEVLTDEQLRRELLVFNANIGPITDTTRMIYRLKLLNYLTKEGAASSNEQPDSAGSGSSVTSLPDDVTPRDRDRASQQQHYNTSIPHHYSHPQAHAVQSHHSSSSRIEASGDAAADKSPHHMKPFPAKVADMRSGSQTQSSPPNMSPNMTSTPHFGTGAGGVTAGLHASPSPARQSLGTTPISSGAGLQSHSNYSQAAKLFGDVPTNYPQLRHRVAQAQAQPSAGSTPSASFSKPPHAHPYSLKTATTTSRTTVTSSSAAATSLGAGGGNEASSKKRGVVFYVKFGVYCFLCFVIFLAFLVWLNMEPAVSV